MKQVVGNVSQILQRLGRWIGIVGDELFNLAKNKRLGRDLENY
jgi:hypothetical protein